MVSERSRSLEQSRFFLEKALAARPGFRRARALPGEASVRSFFRLEFRRGTLVAMVYPRAAAAEIARVTEMTALLRAHGLAVPEVREVIGERAVLLEDGGDLLLQRAYRDGSARRRGWLLDAAADALLQLRRIPAAATPRRLDPERLAWELDFFVAHYQPAGGASRNRSWLPGELHALAARLAGPPLFAHRDFHSRNILVQGRRLLLVDFQDALQAPPHYDLVSLAFDAYLDLGRGRERLLARLSGGGVDVDAAAYRLTALQRNIKALGTFAFQVTQRRHRGYARYVPRTLRHIRGHFRALNDPALERLEKFFAGLAAL